MQRVERKRSLGGLSDGIVNGFKEVEFVGYFFFLSIIQKGRRGGLREIV